jgi:hypothetical protein
MSLHTVRNDLHAPVYWRAFAVSTAAVLHSTDAPAPAQNLPSLVIFNGGAAGGNAVFKDVGGTTVTFALQAGQMLPIGGVAELTSANACTVLVGWCPEP